MIRARLNQNCNDCVHNYEIDCCKAHQNCSKCSRTDGSGNCRCLHDTTPEELSTNSCKYFKQIPKPNKRLVHHWHLYNTQSKTWSEAYAKPSKAKRQIFEKWQEVFNGKCKIITYNSHCFTIGVKQSNIFIVIMPNEYLYCKIADLQSTEVDF